MTAPKCLVLTQKNGNLDISTSDKTYSKHRIDSFRKLSTTRLIDAASINPSPLKPILLAFSTKVQNLTVACFGRERRGVGDVKLKLLQRYFFGTPGVRENDIGRSLSVDKFSEFQGIEVEEAHLEAL
jgi:hypothetical protein